MDFSKLSTGDKVLSGGAIGLVIFTGKLPLLIALLMIAYVVVTKLVDGTDLPDTVPWPMVVLGVAGLAAVLVVGRLVFGYKVDYVLGSITLDRSIGLYLATIAALTMAGGAFLRFQEDGGELPTKKSGGTGTGTPGTGDGGSATPF